MALAVRRVPTNWSHGRVTGWKRAKRRVQGARDQALLRRELRWLIVAVRFCRRENGALYSVLGVGVCVRVRCRVCRVCL